MSERNLNVSNPSAAKIEQQRKILEELERQKKVRFHFFQFFHSWLVHNLFEDLDLCFGHTAALITTCY